MALCAGHVGTAPRAGGQATARRATAPLVIAAGAAVDLAAAFGALDGVPGIGGLLLVVRTVALTFTVALCEARAGGRTAHGASS